MGVFDHFPYTNIHELNLSWILKLVRELDSNVDQLNEWKETHEHEYEELKSQLDAILEGNFPPEMINSLYKWMEDNAPDLIEHLIKTVFFGITPDGYFVAYIPDSWDDITFNTTGHDINIPGYDFGHLVLSY